MTYGFVVNTLTQCATLLIANYGKETFYKNTLDFIIHSDKKYIIGVPYNLKVCLKCQCMELYGIGLRLDNFVSAYFLFNSREVEFKKFKSD